MNNKYKLIRINLGFSIEEMSQSLGVHRQTLFKWENDERIPTNGTKKLYEIFVWLKENNELTLKTMLHTLNNEEN